MSIDIDDRPTALRRPSFGIERAPRRRATAVSPASSAASRLTDTPPSATASLIVLAIANTAMAAALLLVGAALWQ